MIPIYGYKYGHSQHMLNRRQAHTPILINIFLSNTNTSSTRSHPGHSSALLPNSHSFPPIHCFSTQSSQQSQGSTDMTSNESKPEKGSKPEGCSYPGASKQERMSLLGDCELLYKRCEGRMTRIAKSKPSPLLLGNPPAIIEVREAAPNACHAQILVVMTTL